MDAGFEELLARHAHLDGDYGPKLSSHLPMALLALKRMGATTERLEEFAAKYRRKLVEKKPATVAIDAANWRSYLGQHEHHAAYAAYFRREVAAHGREAALKAHVPALMPGCAGGAFHGLLRLTYALDSGSDVELVEGLAYWANVHLPLGPVSPTRSADPAAALAALSADPYWRGRTLNRPTIFERMADVARDPRFADAVTAPARLPEIAAACLTVYAATDDFTALHMVTACHGARLLQPYMGDEKTALTALWIAIVAAYVTIGCPALDVPELPSADWTALFTRAIASPDEHVIKLVYTAAEEERAYGHPLYRAVATRKAR